MEAMAGARLNHRLEFQGGLLEQDCRDQLQAFFQRRRQAAQP
jgi:tRNA(adenine34) deaminase